MEVAWPLLCGMFAKILVYWAADMRLLCVFFRLGFSKIDSFLLGLIFLLIVVNLADTV